MKTYLLFLLYLFIFIGSVSGQQGDIEKLKNHYGEYFKLNREGVYLHVNKNQFLKDEQIFFTAYLYNQESTKPLQEATNLYVGLYDSKGKQLEKSMWYVKNGRAHGNINLKPESKHGTYYVKASTNWMKNFQDQQGYIKKIEILEYEFEDAQIKDKKYSLRLIPEGGQVVSNISNTFGFQIIDEEGNGVPLQEGKVLDSLGNVIVQNIKSNAYGLGKFNIQVLDNHEYSCRFELKNGQILQKILPRSTKKSFALNITGSIKDKRMINIRANPEIKSDLKKNNFYLAIHRDGHLKLFAFTLDKEHKTFSVNKDLMVAGINIVSLLDENLNILAERLIFNHRSISRLDIETDILTNNNLKDSTQIVLKLVNAPLELTTLSVAIVPEQSVAIDQHSSIVGELLLQPYLDHFAQLTRYYLKEFDRKTVSEIDLLLLVHGKSNFSWGTFYDEIPKQAYAPENGISIEGVLNNKKRDKIKSVAIFQEQIDLLKTSDIKKDGAFSIQNAHILKGEPINITLIDQKGNMQRPELDLNLHPKMRPDSIDITKLSPFKDTLENNEIIMTDVKHLSIEKTVALDNVTVIANSRENQPTKNPRLTKGFWNSKKITEKDLVKNKNLSHYLRSIGFKVWVNPNQSLMVYPKLTIPFMQPPIIYLNGFKLRDELIDFSLNTIDEVYYEHAGLMESNGGTIYIYRKAGSLVGKKTNENFSKTLATEGFQRPLEFELNINPNEIDDTFENYGCLSWEPIIFNDLHNEFNIKLPKMKVARLKIIIEGISNNGALISEIRTIDLPKN